MGILIGNKRVLETMQMAIAGAALGACGGAVVAYTTFIAFGLWPEHWENVVPELLWGAFVGFPFGLFVGGSAGVFVGLRARRLDSFRRLTIETVSLAVVATVLVTESLLSDGYSNVERVRVALAVAFVGGGLTAVGMQLLKSLYWPPTHEPNQ